MRDRRTDTVSRAKRSEIMRTVRSHGNRATELALVQTFRAHGITGWRRHQSVFGKPDFVFSKLRLAMFVDGCFWHGCPLHCRVPASNRSYWLQKVGRNKIRDQLVNRKLRGGGWRVVRIWEHDFASKRQAQLLRRIRRTLA